MVEKLLAFSTHVSPIDGNEYYVLADIQNSLSNVELIEGQRCNTGH
jgi:hypothetical protein